MDCDDVEFFLAAPPEGATIPQRELDAHVATCETCRELAAAITKQPLHWIVGLPEDAFADRDLLALAVVDPVVFEMEAELARGGMGRVAKARDRRLGRDVAIKEVLSPHLDARFAREVAITAQLQHPAIVPVYEAGRWPDGSAFYAMRLVSGGTLAAAIAKTRTLEDRLALLPHVIALTDALAYAHANRIIHRDLKPGNVLVGEFGETVVIDWGLAKQLDRAIGDGPDAPARPSASNLTHVGAVMGTPGFMSPEQLAGAPLDERTDVYALGAILYNLLAGKAPYWFGDTTVSPALIEQREREGPPEPLSVVAPRVPEDLQAIVARAMAPDRAARYANAKELADELRRFAAGQLLLSRSYSTGELLVRWLRRHRTAVAIAVIAIIGIAVLGATSIHQTVRRKREAERALADSRIEQGRQLLVAGKPGPAAVLFAQALDRVDDPIAHHLASIAVRDADRRIASFVGTFAAFRPDGAMVAIGHRDGSVALVDADTGAVRDTLPGSEPVTALAYSATGAKLLLATQAGVPLVDPATRAATPTYRGHVEVARFAGDAIVVADEASIHLIANGADRQAAAGGVRGFDVLGDRLLALTPTATLVWSLPDLRPITVQPPATYALFDREGGVVMADRDALERVSLADGSRTVLRIGETQPLTRLRDGSLATGTELVDIAAHTTHELPPDVASELVAALDVNHVITGGFDRMIRIVRLDLARPLVVVEAANAIEFLIPNAAGTRVLSVGHNGAIELWDTDHQHEPVLAAELGMPIERIAAGRSSTAAWLHEGDRNQVAILDATHHRVGLVPGWPMGYRPGSDELVGNEGGKLFVYAGATGAQLRVIADAAGIQTAAYSPSGAVLVTCAAGRITLRDAQTGAAVGDFDTRHDDITTIAIDDAGKIVTGDASGGLAIWDGHAHTAIGKLDGHDAHVAEMVLRGDRLVTTSWDRTIRAWTLAAGSAHGVQLPVAGHALAVSPSGRWIATVDRSALVSVWDAAGGRLLEQLPASAALDAVAFSGEDQLVVGGGAGKLELIDLHERERSTDELIRLARAMQP